MIKQSNEQKRLNSLSIYLIITILFCLIGGSIIGKAVYTATVKKNYWVTIDKRLVRYGSEPARRGNIYSCNGELMATSVPYYTIYIDFKTQGLTEIKTNKDDRRRKDTINSYKDSLDKYIIPLSAALSKKFKDKSAKEYEAHIRRGYNLGITRYQLISRRISHDEWKDLCKFPFLSLGRNKSGLYNQAITRRLKPYGSLASYTIGDILGSENKGKNGLELYYDSLLSGVSGKKMRRKMRGEWISVVINEPTNGMDITTTIDLTIQDITEKALLDMLKTTAAESGTAVVMEVATGEVKAISNMGRIRPGIYEENMSYAIADMSAPGSTFKVASMMVALEEGVVKPGDTIDTGNGAFHYHPRVPPITDHRSGGFGRITAEQVIWNSSNIGMAKIIMKGFGDNPKRYVEKIKELGFSKPMDLEIQGAGRVVIKDPSDKKTWWISTLPSMAYGYETQIPPIYTLTFYNAIANNGKMVKPHFTKKITSGNKDVKTFGVEVVNPSICSKPTLAIIRQMLEDVVDKGTGVRYVKSEKVAIAGKTGTARLSDGRGGYDGHQVSFCGYFPANKPKYSCIVVIRRPQIGLVSGAVMAGSVFKNIAECTHAATIQIKTDKLPIDTTHAKQPIVKGGGRKSIDNVLSELNINYKYTDGKTDWVQPIAESEKVLLKPVEISENRMPSVIGMGAKEAVFLLEKSGLKVELLGKGTVTSQSILSGTKITKGEKITIRLE